MERLLNPKTGLVHVRRNDRTTLCCRTIGGRWRHAASQPVTCAWCLGSLARRAAA